MVTGAVRGNRCWGMHGVTRTRGRDCRPWGPAMAVPCMGIGTHALVTRTYYTGMDCLSVLSLVSLKELVFWGRWSVSLWTHLCYFAVSMHSFSQSLSIVLRCGGLLRNVSFSFSNARCIGWPGFALIKLSCRCVIDVMLLHSLCCTRLIRTRIIVCSVSFHPLLSEFGIPSCGCNSSTRVWSIKV